MALLLPTRVVDPWPRNRLDQERGTRRNERTHSWHWCLLWLFFRPLIQIFSPSSYAFIRVFPFLCVLILAVRCVMQQVMAFFLLCLYFTSIERPNGCF